MQVFKDKEGKPWQLELTVGDVIRIQALEPEFHLFDPLADELARRLAADDQLPFFWRLLWYLVEPQAANKQIDAEAFGKLMAADCLITARQKFLAEWTDFFRQLQRPELATVLEKLTAYNAKAIELVTQRLQTNPTLRGLDERVTRKMEQELSARFGELEGSLDSILDPIPSAPSG